MSAEEEGDGAGADLGVELHRRIRTQAASGELSATVLLSSFFGDVVEPRNAFVSVAGIAAAVAPLGVSERSVRTALSRLVGEGLLVSQRRGVRSFYGVSPDALSTFGAVRRRVFHGSSRVRWDGWWTMVVIDSRAGDAGMRSALRDELRWLGLASFAPNMLISSGVSPESVAATTRRFSGVRALVTRSQLIGVEADSSPDVTVAWQLTEMEVLQRRYEAFLSSWRPASIASGSLSTDCAMAARILLVSDLRKVVLADPALPDELLPSGWPAREAVAVAQRVFRSIEGPSEEFLAVSCETLDGPLPQPAPEQGQRFAQTP